MAEDQTEVFDTAYFLKALPYVQIYQVIDIEQWPIATRGRSVTLESLQPEPQYTGSLMQPPPSSLQMWLQKVQGSQFS